MSPEQGTGREEEWTTASAGVAARPAARRPGPRIMLSGYYGFGNLGDEAVLAAAVGLLRRRLPEAELVVLSADPALTSRELRVRALNRLNPLDIVGALRQTSLFLSGGGSLLQDATSSRSIIYYTGLLLLAQRLNVPTMVFGQGIGPVDRALNRRLVRRALRHVRLVAVRDADSRQELLDMGCDGSRLVVTADLALALDPAPAARAEELLVQAGLDPARPVIGLAVRPWPSWCERQLKCFTAVLAQQARAWDAQILVLPFQVGQDLGFCQELALCLDVRPGEHRPEVALWSQPLAPAEMLALVGRLDMVLGMRLHALIMAARMGVPAVGIAYDPKVASFAQQVGYDYIPSVTALQDTRHLSTVLTKTWQGRAAIQDRLGRLVGPLRTLAQQNVEYAAEVLASSAPAPAAEQRSR